MAQFVEHRDQQPAPMKTSTGANAPATGKPSPQGAGLLHRAGRHVGDDLKKRLAAAKARVRYHSRRGVGASRTQKPQGEALSLARADVEQLSHFITNMPTTQDEGQPEKRS